MLVNSPADDRSAGQGWKGVTLSNVGEVLRSDATLRTKIGITIKELDGVKEINLQRNFADRAIMSTPPQHRLIPEGVAGHNPLSQTLCRAGDRSSDLLPG